MEFILDFILHIDQYMISIVQDYHTWAYAILFTIIFCETGLVLTPFFLVILYFSLQEPFPHYPVCRSISIFLF